MPVLLGLRRLSIPLVEADWVAVSNRDTSSLFMNSSSGYWAGPDNEPYYWQDRAGTLIYQNFRFTNVNVPQGARIVRAQIILHTRDTLPAAPHKWNDIGLEQVDNATQITSNTNFLTRTRNVSLRRRWYYPAQTMHQAVSSPELAALVQEVVNRPGWASGNAMQFFGFTDISSVAPSEWTADPQMHSYAHNGGVSSRIPRLEIDYMVGSPDITINQFLPAVNLDTCMTTMGASSGGAPNVDYLSIITNNNTSSGRVLTHFRFPNITVPQGAEVVTATFSPVVRWYDNNPPGNYTNEGAYVEYGVAQQDNTSVPTTNGVIQGYYNNNPYPFRHYKYPDFNYGAYTRTNEADLTSMVNSVINRSGWASGNAITVFGVDSDSVPSDHGMAAIPRSVEPSDPSLWPRLTIAWRMPS